MKHLKHLLAALVLVSLIIFSNCGGGKGNGNEPDPTEVQGEKLAQSWTLEANGAKNVNDTRTEWNGFTLDITFDPSEKGGTYTTTGSASTEVWLNSGDWAFNGDIIDEVIRDNDGIIIEVSIVTSSALELKFTIPSGTSRESSTSGAWTFNFEN